MKTFQEWLAEREGDQIDEVGVLPILAGGMMAASGAAVPAQSSSREFIDRISSEIDAAEKGQEEAKAIIKAVKDGTANLNDPKVKMVLLYNPEHDPNCPTTEPAKSDFIIAKRREADRLSQASQVKGIMDKALQSKLQGRLDDLKAKKAGQAGEAGAKPAEPGRTNVFGEPAPSVKDILRSSLGKP